ncbi:MAG: glycogen/starch synthase [Flavobacteriales bacterium]|nr:glycogen/starch synthase [Flavobacteriales bacterium]MCB9449748.1 glycogen/starch synthase [Flavobacteriales bacterium]
MEKTKVLFVSQEIYPYLKETEMNSIARHLPQGIQEKNKDIRTFMPRFGCINERRHQLHEVIRLSGMNLIINDSDHPLIIKVASIQAARMQVYFIDNEDYFHRKFVTVDQNNKFYADNDERSIFFCRGVLETVKKLGWAPDIIHCHGWMTSFLPLFLKKAFNEDPLFADSKVVFSVYNDGFKEKLDKKVADKVLIESIEKKDVKHLATPTYTNLIKTAVDHSDAVIYGSPKVDAEVASYVKSTGKPTLEYKSKEEYVDAYDTFYDEVVLGEPALMN